MSKKVAQPISPWVAAVQEGLDLGGGSTPVLIVSPPGSLHVDCAKEIHRCSGGGSFERVICTPDSVALQTTLFGLPIGSFADSPWIDPDPPIGAIQRSAGGTLFLDFVDRCNSDDAERIRTLLDLQPVTIGMNTTELDFSTRVIASVTNIWMDNSEYAIPEWLKVLFGGRIIFLQPLGGSLEDVSHAVEWFSRIYAEDSENLDSLWSSDAKELLVNRQWAGGCEELRDVVRSLVLTAGHGEEVTADMCERVLAGYEDPGMKALDHSRRQACTDYAQKLSYMGRPLHADELYRWAEQFSRASRDRRFDPWSAGLRLVREIALKYYYSSDRLHSLIRNAYLSLCAELADKDYITDWSPNGHDVALPRSQAVVVNPLGPTKSSSAVLPQIAHLLGLRSTRQVVPIGEVATCLSRNESIRVVVFCDDFSGTGQQVLTQFVQVLGNDPLLKMICEKRYREGRPVILGVVLGVGFVNALSRIQTEGPSWLPVIVHAGEQLDECDRAFSDTSSVFPEPELRSWAKELIVDQVGRCLFPECPGGFGNLQALVVTSDNAPNNTLPVIWRSGSVNGAKWKALFERAPNPSG